MPPLQMSAASVQTDHQPRSLTLGLQRSLRSHQKPLGHASLIGRCGCLYRSFQRVIDANA